MLRKHPTHPLAAAEDDDIQRTLDSMNKAEASALIDELIHWTDSKPAPTPVQRAAASVSGDPLLTKWAEAKQQIAENDSPATWAEISEALTEALNAPDAKPFVPSAYVLAIIEAVRTSADNLFIEAVAGSGKTTTLIEIMKVLCAETQLSVLFCAFNRSIAQELEQRPDRPREAAVSTLHSLGFRALRTQDKYVQFDEKAVRDKIAECLPASLSNMDRRVARLFAEKMVGLLKNTLTEPDDTEAIFNLLDHFGIEDNGIGQIVIPLLPFIMSELDRMRYIDFDDMIARVVKFNVPLPKYDIVLVDEAQDLNPAQIALVQMMAQAGARIVAVGDRNQSIYGFRGADINAIPKLIETLSMRSLPLSICYRCPVSHIRLAQQIVPHIEAREDAPEGVIDYLSWEQMVAKGTLTPNETLVLCRRNAPLIKRAFSLIRAGVPTTVKGRDIGQGIINLINKLSRPSDEVLDLVDKANAYHTSERQKLMKRDVSESMLQALDDRMETLYALCEGAETITEIKDRTEKLFSDTNGIGMVICSSVHRAKGLQSQKVVLLEPWTMPLRVRRDWEREQEENILYVARTRSQDTLVLEVDAVAEAIWTKKF